LIDLRPRTLASKVPFVVLIIGSLALGLGLTLWLSTASAERSYQLSHARHKNRMLQQQKEALERDVREAEAAPALAEAARKQGMIPTRDTAHLVQDPTGSWVVVGTPKPADGVPPPPLNAKLPEDGPPQAPKAAGLPPRSRFGCNRSPVARRRRQLWAGSAASGPGRLSDSGRPAPATDRPPAAGFARRSDRRTGPGNDAVAGAPRSGRPGDCPGTRRSAYSDRRIAPSAAGTGTARHYPPKCQFRCCGRRCSLRFRNRGSRYRRVLPDEPALPQAHSPVAVGPAGA